MSFLICGLLRFTTGRPWTRQQQLAFQIAEAGLAERLFVLLGLNVAASPTSFEILNIPDGPLRDDQLPFAITDSPVDPTADGLICPLENSEEALRANMARLGQFFAALWRIVDLDRIEVYLSEGYDDVYDEEEVEIEKFEQVATEKILAAFGPNPIEAPSPKLVLSRSPKQPTS